MLEKSPSAGKTVAIAGSLPLAVQNLLYVILHDVWGLAWASPEFVSNLVMVAVALAGALMHRNQRRNEDVEQQKNLDAIRNSGAGLGGAAGP